jgi:hemerythrin
VIDVLKDLRAHAAAHFDREDADLRRFKPANAQCHLDEHAAVLKSLDGVILELSSQETNRDQAESLQKELAAELLRWLPEHVTQMDGAIAKARAQHNYGGNVIKLTRRTSLQIEEVADHI